MRDTTNKDRTADQISAKQEHPQQGQLLPKGPPAMGVLLVWVIAFWGTLFSAYALLRLPQ